MSWEPSFDDNAVVMLLQLVYTAKVYTDSYLGQDVHTCSCRHGNSLSQKHDSSTLSCPKLILHEIKKKLALLQNYENYFQSITSGKLKLLRILSSMTLSTIMLPQSQHSVTSHKLYTQPGSIYYVGKWAEIEKSVNPVQNR